MRDRAIWVALVSALISLGPVSSASANVVVHVPGYTYVPFVTTTAGEEDLELDPAGNIYLGVSGNFRRITPGGVETPWSSATADDIVFSSTGDAYGAGRASCHCVLSISAGGAFSPLHSDSLEWTYIALGQDGTLYSSIVGVGQGLYSIDRTTGVPTLLVSGGPAPGDSGYEGMLGAMDGKLYVNGGSTALNGLFRLDGSQFTHVATWPHGGVGLAQDNQGIFYTAVSIFPIIGSQPPTHEVWMYDPSTGTATLLAEGNGGCGGLAYDRSRNLLYVANGLNVYIIGKGPTPTRRETWGAVKAKFH